MVCPECGEPLVFEERLQSLQELRVEQMPLRENSSSEILEEGRAV